MATSFRRKFIDFLRNYLKVRDPRRSNTGMLPQKLSKMATDMSWFSCVELGERHGRFVVIKVCLFWRIYWFNWHKQTDKIQNNGTCSCCWWSVVCLLSISCLPMWWRFRGFFVNDDEQSSSLYFAIFMTSWVNRHNGRLTDLTKSEEIFQMTIIVYSQ